MNRKLLYTYNPDTDTYQPVNYSLWQRCLNIMLYVIGGIIVGMLLYMIFDFLTRDDRENELHQRNEQLQERLKSLERQTDEAIAVMHDIADRDNNFYRVLMQADPLSDPKRYANLRRDISFASADSLGDVALVHSVESKLSLLESQLYSQSKSFDFIRSEAIKRKGRLEYMPAIQPVSFDDLEHLASGFGRRTDPVYGTSKMHQGMDFSAETGAPVYATAKGTVTSATWHNGYGNAIYVDHGYDYETRYAHLSEILVKEGDTVERGQLIGKVGNTGKSTGPHLHYEVRFRDIPQNPINYYFYDMTPEQYDALIREAQNAGHVMD